MLAFIPLAVLVTTSLLFRDLLDQDPTYPTGWREAFFAAVIVMGAFIALSSEALSLLRALTLSSLVILWLGVFFLMIAFVLKRKAIQRILGVWNRLDWRNWPASNRLLLLVSILYVAVLFVVARLAPPNTNDSLSYHLSRVMHWIQEQGVVHYATAIDRQLWMPPWAEMAIMQLHLLKGDDGLSNLVQWFSMLACLVGVSLLARRLGAGIGGQLMAVLFCLTLPMGILQATSTQTDYATALWLVGLAFYTLLAHQRQLSRLEWLLLGLTVALGVLTKGTYYIFALPFLLWLLISVWRRSGWLATAGPIALGFIVVAIINAGTWLRNSETFGFPLGPWNSITTLSNESISPGILVSNLIRNSTLHLGTPYGVVNGPMREQVDMFHALIGQDPQDPRTTLDEYRIKRYLHEDRAGNPFHFLLVPVTLFLLLVPASGRLKFFSPLLFALLILSTFLIFSAVYKWQSTGSRLLLPFFVAWSPITGIVLERPVMKAARLVVVLILIAASIHPLISNPSRALLPLSPDFASLLTTPREQLLFANSPEVMPAYHSLASDIRDSGCMVIGLMIDSSDIEYPFWYLLGAPTSGARIEHLDLQGESAKYLAQDFKPCAIVCSYCSDETQHDLPLTDVYQGVYSLYISSTKQAESFMIAE
jgi:hypothetical protein